MKREFRNLLQIVSGLLLAGGLVFVHPVLAGTSATTPEQAQHIKQDATVKAKQAAKEKSASYNAEAVAAIKDVEQAAQLLAEGKHEDAIKQLETADGKLEVAMAADPGLKLIPVAADVMTFDLITTPEAVKSELNSVGEALEAGNVQAARVRLDRLRSEIVTSYIYLPVETYPAAIKRAVSEINAKQYTQARDTLAMAMDSLVETVEATPLPVVMAHGAILEAEELQSTDKKKALQDLDFASEQMQTAERLGYFYDDVAGYKEVMQHIEALRDVMGGTNKLESLFTNAKNSMKHLIDKMGGKEVRKQQ